MDINFFQTDNMHSCETQMTTVMNDWAKILNNGGQADTFSCEILRKHLTPHRTSSLRTNCLAMA